MTQSHHKYFFCISYYTIIVVFILFAVIVKIDSLEIDRSNIKFSQKSSKLSYLHNIPLGAFMSSPSYLLSQKLFGVISYTKSGNSREMTKLVYSYQVKSSDGENKPNDIVLGHLDVENSFIYIPDETLSSFKDCEIEGNYHHLKSLIKKCEDLTEFVNSTVIEATPEIIQFNSSHLIVDDTPIEVIPHTPEEIDHLIKSLNYKFYPMKCDRCIGTVNSNMFVVFLDDRIMSITKKSEKDIKIENELVKITTENSITHIENNDLYCTMLSDKDKVIYCIKNEEKEEKIRYNELDIVFKGKKLTIEPKNHIIDEYIKYVNEINEEIVKYLENSLINSKRYLNEKNQKDISIKTYPLNEKSSFVESLNNNKIKYVIVNGKNIMKLKTIVKYSNSTLSSSIYDKMNYHIELDTDYLKNKDGYSILEGENIYYFMMSPTEDIYYKSNTEPSGSIDYDKLKKSTFENEEMVIQESIDSMNEVVNEVAVSIEEYNTRYGIANDTIGSGNNNNNVLIIYTGNEYVEMYKLENNVFRFVYKLEKDNNNNNNMYNVKVLNEDKSQIKFSSKSSYIKKCNGEIDSVESYSIKEIREKCPTSVIDSILNSEMNLKLPFTLESVVSINKDKSITRKLLIKTTNDNTIERVLKDENRIELIDNIINTSLQTSKINLANKYMKKNDINNNMINYLSSKYVMSVKYDNDESNYCSVLVDRINKTMLREELTTFVINEESENKEYNCFNFEDNEEYVYCLKNKMLVDDDIVLDIGNILDNESFDRYTKIENSNNNEIKVSEITELKDCYFNIQNMIETEIEKEKEMSEKYEEMLFNDKRMMNNYNSNYYKNIKEGKDKENEEEEDSDKIIDINGIYESNYNNKDDYYKGIYITSSSLYQIIKIKRNTLQISYIISIIKNDQVYKVKIISVDEKNTGLYNEKNEFKQMEVKDIPTQFSELLIPISVSKEYEMKETEKHYSLQIKDTMDIELIKCSENNVKSMLDIVKLPTKPVNNNKAFHNELSYENNKLKVFYSKDLYVTSEDRDSYCYKNSIQLNFDNNENNNDNENITNTKFYDDYYTFDVESKIYSSNTEYIEYYKYINNTCKPSEYSDKIAVLQQSLKYIKEITIPIQHVIDNLIEPEVMNYTKPNNNGNGNGNDDGGDGDDGKYHFNTMEILAIVFASLFVVIVFGFSVWSCVNCYKDKKAVKEIEMEEMNRVYREKNGFIPTSNKEFIKIQMMPKM